MVLEHALQYVNGDEWDTKTVYAVYFKLYGIGMWYWIFQPSELYWNKVPERLYQMLL